METPSRTEGRAEWIWMRPPRTERAGLIPRGEPDFSEDENRFVYFRKVFSLSGKIENARLRVSADGRYLLFLNGRRLGRGPARCHPDWQNLDPYAVDGLLEEGSNVLAVLVHSYGRDSSWYQTSKGGQAILFGCAGFYLEARATTEDGEMWFGTDETWGCLPAFSWKREVPFGGTGYFEDFDAREEPIGWELPGFDDSSWGKACAQRISAPAAGDDLVPFPHLVERDIGPLREEEVAPAAGALRGRGGELVYDFGRILLGRIGVELEAEQEASLEVSYAETLGPDGLVAVPGAIAGISTLPGARLRFGPGLGSHLLFEPAGFRYVQIRANSGKLSPPSVWAEESSYSGGPSPRSILAESQSRQDGAGAFSCSDALLTAIWKAGAYTAAVCRQDAFIDCPSREQRQWTGDAYIQSLLCYVTCPDYRPARRALLQAAQSQRPDGMVAMATTSDLGSSWRTYIPDYSLLWVLAAADYLDYSGDEDVLEELFPAIAKALDWFIPYLDGHGLLASVPGWLFFDWSERLDRRGEVTALNALFAAAVRAGARVAEAVGAGRFARRWGTLAESVAAAAAERLWDEERGVYADARTDGGLSRVVSQQANAAAIAFGIAAPERWDRIFSAIMDEDRLRLTRTWRWDIERPFDPEKDVVLAQPYFCRFLHAALAKAGRLPELLKSLSRWDSMLRDGGSTFWESWQITEMTSRCHAFSATPTYDLSTYVLGLRPTDPGFSRFEARPFFGDLDWAEGRLPTPKGPLSLSWRRRGRTMELEVEVPEGLSGRLVTERAAPGAKEHEEIALLPGRNRLSIGAPSST